MMTHCPNFQQSPITLQQQHRQSSISSSSTTPPTTPIVPLLSLPLPHMDSTTTTTTWTTNHTNLFLPSLLWTSFRRKDDTPTTTITNETTPLLSSSSPSFQVDTVEKEEEVVVVVQETDDTNMIPTSNVTSTNVLHHPSQNRDSICIHILYGIIHATIVIPVILTFTTIIYSHTLYHPYYPILTSCTLFSSLMHQIVFSTLSTLPFAIGQVQDAGLIFLSNMATQLALHYSSSNDDPNIIDIEHLIPTTMMALSLSTIVLGMALMIIGYYQWAQYVQLLPTCVVGGYLAYIGYFCGKAGILMMISSLPKSTTTTTTDLTTMTYIKVVPELYFVLPGIVGGIVIYISIRSMKYMMTLPVCILMEMILFYMVLYSTNTSIHDATMQGWIRNTHTNDATAILHIVSNNNSTADTSSATSYNMWYHTWDYLLQFHNIDWYIMLKLIPNVIGMIFVVTLSSSLDVTAIEIELQQQQQQQQQRKAAMTQKESERSAAPPPPLPSLDYNGELRMIGISNIISGCCGGYTGSYIFSQSIFSLRAGIRSRQAGYVLAMCEFLIFVLPIPILSYVPNFLFASLLIMICIDLIIEWLWDVRHRLTHVEYILCLSTFVLIQTFNVEYGIIAGILLYVCIQQILGWKIGSNTKLVNKCIAPMIDENEVVDLLLHESEGETDR